MIHKIQKQLNMNLNRTIPYIGTVVYYYIHEPVALTILPQRLLINKSLFKEIK